MSSEQDQRLVQEIQRILESQQHPRSVQEIQRFLESKQSAADVASRDSATQARRREYAERWFGQEGLAQVLNQFPFPLADWTATGPIRDPDDERKKQHARQFVQKIKPFFGRQSQPFAPKYLGVGQGLHGGAGVVVAGEEWGEMFNATSFESDLAAPHHAADYQTKWALVGPATGVDLGISFDTLALSLWFADIDKIAGLCFGFTFSASAIYGIGATLFWTKDWKGVGDTGFPIGFSVVSSEGIEEGGGVYLNTSWTDFSKKPT